MEHGLGSGIRGKSRVKQGGNNDARDEDDTNLVVSTMTAKHMLNQERPWHPMKQIRTFRIDEMPSTPARAHHTETSTSYE